MWQEFKQFAMRGNALDLAIGVIIGAAFGKIVGALVDDIIMPVIGIAGKADFSNYFIPLSSAVTATNLADARKRGGVFAYGDFITVVINFLIVAVALFVVIKGINTLNKKTGSRAGRAVATDAGGGPPDTDPRPARQALTKRRSCAPHYGPYLSFSPFTSAVPTATSAHC